MIRAVLTRLFGNGRETLGRMTVYDGLLEVGRFTTAELPWKNNERRVSCIPAGRYQVDQIESPSKGACFAVRNVPNRDFILIHVGNFVPRDTEGCILVGNDFGDLNGDKQTDIVGSRYALELLLNLCPGGFVLDVISI